MSQSDLFMMMLLTTLMTLNGVRCVRNKEVYLGVLLIATPICGWVSLWAGRI